MTVENQFPYQSFTANGLQTNFALGFYVDDKDQLEIKQNGLEVSKSDYNYEKDSNSILFNTIPLEDTVIEISRITVAERSTTYATYNNTFRPETLNKDLDKLWFKLQELQVIDHLQKIHFEALHNKQQDYIDQKDVELQDNINALEVYTDVKNNELKIELKNILDTHNIRIKNLDSAVTYLENRLDFLEINSMLGAGKLFQTVAEGLASTKNGDYFNVISSDENKFADLYKNVSNIAVNQNKSYASDKAIRVLQQTRLWVEQFANSDDLTVDAGGAFRRAIAYAKANNSDTIWFRGNYKITSLETEKWVMPFDDGSLPSSLIPVDAHGVLSPEVLVEMPVHLIIPSNLSIRAENIRNCSLDFDWNVNTGTIAPTAPIAILQQCENFSGTYTPTTTGKNRYNSWVRGNFGGFTLKNAFIGILGDGVRFSDDWQPMRFTGCGISILSAGLDSCRFERLIFEKCLSGLVAGGWWQQRAANSYGYMPLSGDIHAIGWVDATNIGMIHYGLTPLNPTFISTRLNVLDQFFDTYFYKTANNITRLSTYRSADRPTTESDLIAYTGIASRAIWTAPRQRRTGLANRLNFLKVYGSTRAPIYTYEKWEIGEAFTEFVGRVDTTVGLTTGNIYYTDFTDQYLTNTTPFAGVVEEAYYATADSSVDYHSPVGSPRVTSVAKPHRKIPSRIYTMGTDYKFNETTYDNGKVISTARSVVRPITSSTDTTYTHYNITPRLAYWSMGTSFKNSTWTQVEDDGEILFQSTAYGNTIIDSSFYSVIRLGSGSATSTVTVPCRMNYVRDRGMVKLLVFFNVTEALLASTHSVFLQVFSKIPEHTGNDSWGIRDPNFKLVAMPVATPTVPVRATFNKNALGMQITFWKDYAATEAFKANEFVGTGRVVFEIEYTTNAPL